MIRKDSPKLKAEVAEFSKKHGGKSAFGNELLKKYGGDGNPRVVKQATSSNEIKKFEKTVEFFQKYGAQYDMDYLLMIAQGYQESLLDQNAKSDVGAIGVMQLMPATGKEMNTGDVTQLEPNIHAGIKYVRLVRDQFFESEPMDTRNKILFSFAAYNAGPEHLVQHRRADRRATNRQGNGHVRGQHLQILLRVHPCRGTAGRKGKSSRRATTRHSLTVYPRNRSELSSPVHCS
jgi:membrane-bound lytic murein transglycosylase MltF